MPVVIRGAIGPPRRPALAKGTLRRIDARPRGTKRVGISLRLSDSTAGGHQLMHKPLTLGQRERRIAQPPQPATDHEVPPIGCTRVLGICKAMIHAAMSHILFRRRLKPWYGLAEVPATWKLRVQALATGLWPTNLVGAVEHPVHPVAVADLEARIGQVSPASPSIGWHRSRGVAL